MLENYDFISADTLAYFQPRLTQAPKDSEFALAFAKEHAITRVDQEKVINALRFKCDLLWAMLDALYFSYVEPGFVPPGAFKPQAN